MAKNFYLLLLSSTATFFVMIVPVGIVLAEDSRRGNPTPAFSEAFATTIVISLVAPTALAFVNSWIQAKLKTSEIQLAEQTEGRKQLVKDRDDAIAIIQERDREIDRLQAELRASDASIARLEAKVEVLKYRLKHYEDVTGDSGKGA